MKIAYFPSLNIVWCAYLLENNSFGFRLVFFGLNAIYWLQTPYWTVTVEVVMWS